MTIPALLRHVSVSTPRYVTIDGQVILDGKFDSVSARSRVSEVKPHRFHDGVEPEVRGTGDAAWWTNESAWQADTAEMRERFPSLAPLAEDDDRYYVGVLDTGRGRFRVGLVLRPDRSLPGAVVLEPKKLGRAASRRFVKPPHLYTSGALCIAGIDDWQPTYGTAVAAAWTAHWLACYTEWRFNGGIWPSDGYVPHIA